MDVLVYVDHLGNGRSNCSTKYVQFWYPQIPNWITAAFTILILVTLNLFSAKLFGELEFWLAIIKVVTIVALITVGIVMVIFAFKTPYGTANVTYLESWWFLSNGASGFFMSFKWQSFHSLVLN